MLTKLMSEKLKFAFLILIVVLIIFLVRYLGIESFLSPNALKEKVLSYGAVAPLVFVVIYAVATIFFLPGTPITIAGGLIFGKLGGTALTVIGATIGAVIAFLVSRALGEKFVESLLKGKYNKLYEYDKKIEKNGFLVVLFLRLIPLFPFNGLNFALGLTKVRKRDYIMGTAIGIIPGSFVLAFFGDSIANFSILNILISIALFALLAFLPFIYRRLKSRKKTEKI